MSSRIKGEQIQDGTVCRIDLNTTTLGRAVITKIIQGQGITITSTGVDSGTGDVTISATGGGSIDLSQVTNNYISKWNTSSNRFVNSVIYDDGTNVGIGTSSPSSPLDVTYVDANFNAGVSVCNTSTNSYALPSLNIKDYHKNAQAQFSYITPFYANPALRNTVLFNSIYKGVHLGFVTSSGGGNDPYQSAANMGDIYFQTGPSAANKHLFISGTSGYLGMGITSPTEKLHVVGNIKLTGKLVETIYGNITSEVSITNILPSITANVANVYYFKTTLTAQTTLNFATLSNLVSDFEYSVIIIVTTNPNYTLYVTDSYNGGGSIQSGGSDVIVSIKFRKIGTAIVITSFN